MKLPTQLSYQRSLSPSIAVFFSEDGNGAQTPINIKAITILGQKGSSSEAFSSNMDIKQGGTHKKLAEGNPHTIDYCYAPVDSKYLLCKFSLCIDAGSLAPRVCNDEDVRRTLVEFSDTYHSSGGYRYLAKKYLYNIASGSWLWRNQKTLNTNIHLASSGGFNTTIENINRKRFDSAWYETIPNWQALITEFESALVTPQKYMFIEVSAKMSVPLAHEIHPSQAFRQKMSKTDKSRSYQHTTIGDVHSPIIGAYKIGAAIACIDDWYDDAEKTIRVGSYGVDKSHSTVYRPPDSQKDIFSLLCNIENVTSSLKSNNKENSPHLRDAHFIAANLIKGGLFGLGNK